MKFSEETPSQQDPSGVYEEAKRSPTFCIYPFTHLATKTEGTFKLCCRSEPLSNVSEISALELWNSERYKSIRRQMLAGEKPQECQDCWSLESFGTRSMRQRALADFEGSRWNVHSPLLHDVHQDGFVPYTPKTIEMKISNLCNLRCRMCHPVDSSSWVKDWPLIDDLMKEHNTWSYETALKQNVMKRPVVAAFEDNETWWKDFEKIAASVDLIEFAGGEPLMDPQHYRILELLRKRAPEIRLKYSTNLTRLEFKGRHVFEEWKNFKSVSLYASIDGLHDVYEYIRTGAKFSTVVENLELIKSTHEVNVDEVAVACTIQVYNVFQLPEIIDFFVNRKIKFHSHRVTAPKFLNTQILPAGMKSTLKTQLEDYRARFMQRSDLSDSLKNHVNKHIEDHLKHMMGRDWSHLIPSFIDYTQRLDRARVTNIVEVVPQLESIFLSPPQISSSEVRP